MKPRKLCAVNKVCRRRPALWWYYIRNGRAVFDAFGPARPNNQAAACCDDCRAAIEASFERMIH